jgi:two-component system sensor histidine kinase KdpD
MKGSPAPTGRDHRDIEREAKVVGLTDVHAPSLEAVERRRLQLWIVMAILLVTITVGAVLLSVWPSPTIRSWASTWFLRLGIVLLSAGFCAYAIEKELHLRRLSALLIDEQILTASLSNRLKEVSFLLEAGKAMNSVLELPAVLDVILRSALELLRAASGSILLMELTGELRAVCVIGNDAAKDRVVRVGQGIAGRVAADREALLINGKADASRFPGVVTRTNKVESAMCVPLLNRDDLSGVLSVNAEPARTFNEFDLRALSMFAEQAAGAIANARLFEAERSYVEELVELDRMKSEFVTMVSQDLRMPLTSILAACGALENPQLVEMHEEVAGIIHRQADQLAHRVDDLLDAARTEQPGVIPALVPLDLCEVAHSAAAESSQAGKMVLIDAPGNAYVLTDPHTVRRVVDHLLEFAYKYGADPIGLGVSEDESRVTISVMDRSASSSHLGRQAGFGLALPVVRALVEACGGAIWIEEGPEDRAACRVSFARCPAPVDAGAGLSTI